jgi:uncharacterized protein DUF6894
MRRYYFHLKDGCRGYADHTGVVLSSDDAARDHARGVAAELMKNRERKARHWHIDVQDKNRKPLFTVAFITVDRTLNHVSQPHRKALEELSQRCYALREAIAQARTVQTQARALVAKSRGLPYLAADDGEAVLSGL